MYLQQIKLCAVDTFSPVLPNGVSRHKSEQGLRPGGLGANLESPFYSLQAKDVFCILSD